MRPSRAIAIMLALYPLVRPAAAVDLAGSVEQLQGSAHATSASGLSRPLRIGSTILVGDQVSTGSGGRLLVRMNDDATLALGEGTTLTVAVYEEDEHSSRAVLGLDKGVLLALAGAIARLGPNRFTVSTPMAVLDIQDSEVWADQSPDHLALALISGNAVTVTTPQGSVELTQAETGVDIVLGESPPRLAHWDSERVENARMAVALP